ncbi:hypothetical protein H4R24_000154 [Coemansia sp. RSA 988]|nr:hypothetical protein H4R24_000154 [Coemansia sp. RSA 988]
MLVRHNPGAMQQVQVGKEPNALPTPSTMPNAQLEQPTVSQKLVWILQYLNPLFYARLAQSLVSTVFGSQAAGGVNSSGGRVTEHANRQIPAPAPVPADASVVDCEYYHISKDSLQDPQYKSLQNLDIVPNNRPTMSTVAIVAEHRPDTCNDAVQPPSAIQAEGSSISHASYGSDGNYVDLSCVSAAPTNPVVESASNNTETTASPVPMDEKTGHKGNKKGKRGKKNRS